MLIFILALLFMQCAKQRWWVSGLTLPRSHAEQGNVFPAEIFGIS